MGIVDSPLALLAGVLTIASPCVLPLLPVLLGTSVERSGRWRPAFVVSGFVLSFASLGIALSLLTSSIDVIHGAVRSTSIVLLAAFGLMRLWPRPYDSLMSRLAGPLQRISALPGSNGSGNVGGFLLGMSLGAVWTPCAGPVLASILILAAKAQDVWQSSYLLLLYAIGAGVPMLGIAYGGKFVAAQVGKVSRHTHLLRQAFGALLILTAFAIYFQYDVLAYGWIADFFS